MKNYEYLKEFFENKNFLQTVSHQDMAANWYFLYRNLAKEYPGVVMGYTVEGIDPVVGTIALYALFRGKYQKVPPFTRYKTKLANVKHKLDLPKRAVEKYLQVHKISIREFIDYIERDPTIRDEVLEYEEFLKEKG